MNLFEVYTLMNIQPVSAGGCWLEDKQGNKYLDLYGGHAVISIGHAHPEYVEALTRQIREIGYYSNSVQNPLQMEVAAKLGDVSGYPDYGLFLCNSGAEAVENALKLASFQTGRKGVVAFKNGFHGRTAGALAATDNPKISAPINESNHVVRCDLNDLKGVHAVLKKKDVAAVIVEGIQGIGGVVIPDDSFMTALASLCHEYGSLLIVDEIQSGFGRTGKFFAHQYVGIRPDLIAVAKGMGNGFPVGGVLIHPDIKPWPGMLGTTFGGNHLACSAVLAVLDVIEKENLVENARRVGHLLSTQLSRLPGVKEVRGRGLMIGVEFGFPVAELRQVLANQHFILTGASSNKNVLRILPPLNVKEAEIETFVDALWQILQSSSSAADE